MNLCPTLGMMQLHAAVTEVTLQLYTVHAPTNLSKGCSLLHNVWILRGRCPDRMDTHMQIKVKGSDRTVVPASEEGSICWICGEVATVEVEIRNPTVIPIKVT